MDPRSGSVLIIGAGISGLITAHTLIQDGLNNVHVLTRDTAPGGVWTDDRIYPGLRLNNVHGEYMVSPMEMPSNKTGSDARLTGNDISAYTKAFADKFLGDKIQYGVEVTGLRRAATGTGWSVDILRTASSTEETRDYSRVVMCTGGCSIAAIPNEFSPSARSSAGFRGMVSHTADFGRNLDDLMHAVPSMSSVNPASVVVIGGGKSGQDAAAYLANEGRKVTLVCPKLDAFTAGPKPAPDFVRKSRLISLFSPHVHLRTQLERFMHTTWAGKKVVDMVWNGLEDSSFNTVSIPPGSPLRNTVSPFWHPRVNDEGVPGEGSFHRLAVNGKITVLCPARAASFGSDGSSIILDDGMSIPADAIILATGYKSSWPEFLDGDTLREIGLDPLPVDQMQSEATSNEWNYTTLSNPPELHPSAARLFSPVYRGIVPSKQITARDFALNGAVISANFGYTVEVTAHWISSYFLGDDMPRLPRTPEAALEETARAGAWLRARYPQIPTALNGSSTSHLAFWSWPQHADDLLEDMGLRVMRSGGNWLTWPFQVIHISEISTLRQERDARREKKA